MSQTADSPVAIEPQGAEPYRVLARKYRPQNFDELVGQDALVRTLKNAIESGRVAHAFMLTGVRGVGKTTTARIIAKALNYTGADGTANATTGSTDDCALCQAISEDRHPDVLEMDAASRTGVDDMRDLLEGVRYAPTQARYKIYIIDEVHMLSKSAFNALLKTLEEPPPHVKFIFATTEIRKVPVTVLSRCQRFDLRRVDVDVLSKHYANICAQENTAIEPEALNMISRAADGSVRDGLSLLDQAIALSGDIITAQQIKDMLGLADRARIMDTLEAALKADTAAALTIMADLYKAGADPHVIIGDMLAMTHILTRLKAVPDSDTGLPSDEAARAKTLAGALSMPTLGKAWQIILKGMDEVQNAPNPQNAAEMVVIRLVYAANLPDPAHLIETLKGQDTNAAAQKKTKNLGGHDTAPRAPAQQSIAAQIAATAPPVYKKSAQAANGNALEAQSIATAQNTPPAPHSIDTSNTHTDDVEQNDLARNDGYHRSTTNENLGAINYDDPPPQPSQPPPFIPRDDNAARRNHGKDNAEIGKIIAADIDGIGDIVAALDMTNEHLLSSQVYQFIRLVALNATYEYGQNTMRLDVHILDEAPDDLLPRLAKTLTARSDAKWSVHNSTAARMSDTMAEQDIAAHEADCEYVRALPVLQDIMAVFPDIELVDILTT